MGFTEATELTRADDGTLAWDVPDGWQQGRGAWGGLVAGGISRAVALAEPDPERRLRTLSVHMSAPLPVSRATVQVAPLRIGSGMSTWAVTVHATDGDLVAHAVAITGVARVADLTEAAASWGTAVPPQLPPWEGLTPLPTAGPGWPTFMQHMEFRPVAGFPLSGGPATCTGYIRLAEQPAWDAATLVAVVDAWFPAALLMLDQLRPLATVTYAAHLLVDPASVTGTVPLAFESHMSAAHDGFTSEVRRLWTPDGRLAVENHQSIAVIR